MFMHDVSNIKFTQSIVSSIVEYLYVETLSMFLDENITPFKHVKVRTVRRYQKTQIEGQMTLRSNHSKGTNNDPQNTTQKNK